METVLTKRLVASYDMPAWDTVDLVYLWTLSLLIRHACMGYSGPSLSLDP